MNDSLRTAPTCVSTRWLELTRCVGSFATALLALSARVGANNLVPNPSFETYTQCPDDEDEVSYAPPWRNPTLASPDYFHACGTGTWTVPNNGYGGQTARTGSAYAGVICYSSLNNNFREYVETPLSAPLVAGRVYQVAFYVSLAENSLWACDRISACVQQGSLGTVATSKQLNLTPQVGTQPGEHIADKNGWTLVRGAFVAAGGEDHLVIGNFLNDGATGALDSGSGSYWYSMYYLDDVSVIEAEPVCTCGAPSWSDTFDTYASGSVIDGQGGWNQHLCTVNTNSVLSTARYVSPPNSVEVTLDSDLVQYGWSGYTVGQWTFRVMQYLPGPSAPDALTDPTWWRLHHQGSGCGAFTPSDVSVEVEFDPASGTWKLYRACAVVASGPLHFDQWVELRAEIDLGQDRVEVFYAGAPLAPPYPWSWGAICGPPFGQLEIAAVQFSAYGSGASSKAYYDCASLAPYQAPVEIEVVSCGSGCLTLDPKVTAVDPSDVVIGRLPNALAHARDAGTRVATHVLVSFPADNPTTGSPVTISSVAPLGGADTYHHVTLLPALSGTYPYDVAILDQDYAVLCTIDPELVAGTAISTYCTAKINSLGCVPSMTFEGAPSTTFGSGFDIRAVNVLSHKTGLLFYGTLGPVAAPFQGGFLCVRPPLKRLPVQDSGGNPPPTDCSGSYVTDFNLRIAQGLDPALLPGVTVNAQYWYRDPAIASTTGLTDSIQFTLP